MPGRLYIRRYHPSDLRRILEIEAACFPEEPYPRELFEDLYRDCPDLFLVAHQGGVAVAYMVTCSGPGKSEIISIAVDPPAQRAGAGTALMRHTLERLRGAGAQRVWLMVRDTNAAARAFYERFGFRRVRRVRRYYENRGDALRMVLNL